MNTAPSGRIPFSRRRTILFGTVAVGTIDICWAFLVSGLSGTGPIAVLQSVAGGWLGKATYDGGLATAFLGMFTHYFIAASVVTTYFLVSRSLPRLAQRPFLFGPLYGLAVYVVMYQFVLPLSAWHTTGLHPIANTAGFLKGLFIHLFGIGLVAALVTRRGTALAQPT